MDGERKTANPNRLTVQELVTVLSNSYRQQIPAEQIEADVASGAPTNPDGTINLAHYAAWLLQEKHRGE